MAYIIGAGPGAALPPQLGALHGGGLGGGGPARTFEQLYREVENWTLKGFWTRNWNAQKKFQNLAAEALDIMHRGIPGGTNPDHVRKVFKEIATHLKRDGDAKSIQQCETEYQTLKVAIEALENMRRTYTNNRMQFKETLPGLAGGPFMKSDALKAIDEAIDERRAELNKLGWEVIQSICFGVGDVSYVTIPKINGLYNRTRELYYKIVGTPAVPGGGGIMPVPRRAGLIDKLNTLETSTTADSIRAERDRTSFKRKIRETVFSKKIAGAGVGFFAPDLGRVMGAAGLPIDAQSLMVRVACAAAAQALVFFFTEDF